MLQISTGRFFADGIPINEQECDAILYSNYSWIAEIKTKVGELRPVDVYSSAIASYVLRYVNRYQPRQPKDTLVMPTGDEIAEQFRLLAAFHFQAFFHVDASYVESLCRGKPRNSADKTLPAIFVPRFFSSGRAGTFDEITRFVAFIDRIVSMPRASYRRLMPCIAGFIEGLEAVGKNFDLAYSMMVYALEALVNTSERPEVLWEDYDQNIRGKLDTELLKTDPGIAEEIRNVLLSAPHLKVKKRFIEFISSHVGDTYFTSEAHGLKFALAKSELRRALENLYASRSGYVHELRELPDQLRMHQLGTDKDVFRWRNEPHFTFGGIVRLVHHVFLNFINRQPVLDREEYDAWRAELSDIVEIQMAPELWVGNVTGFEARYARLRLSGFLSHFVQKFGQKNQSMIDLRPLLPEIAKRVPQAESADRVAMLALYALFTQYCAEADRPKDRDVLLARWQRDTDACSIEVMAVLVLFGSNFPWEAEGCVEIFERYQRLRYRELETNLPRVLEIAIMAQIANKWLKKLNFANYQTWVDRAILDSPASEGIQRYLTECKDRSRFLDTHHLLGAPLAITEQRIRITAYQMWEDDATRPTDDGIARWLQAEKRLLEGLPA